MALQSVAVLPLRSSASWPPPAPSLCCDVGLVKKLMQSKDSIDPKAAVPGLLQCLWSVPKTRHLLRRQPR